jgi:hypothetical protein
MTTMTTKKQMLENAGYAYSFDREIYLNRRERKVFSLDFVEDHPEDVLEAKLRESAPSAGEWHFYFNSPPSAGVERELSAILG